MTSTRILIPMRGCRAVVSNLVTNDALTGRGGRAFMPHTGDSAGSEGGNHNPRVGGSSPSSGIPSTPPKPAPQRAESAESHPPDGPLSEATDRYGGGGCDQRCDHLGLGVSPSRLGEITALEDAQQAREIADWIERCCLTPGSLSTFELLPWQAEIVERFYSGAGDGFKTVDETHVWDRATAKRNLDLITELDLGGHVITATTARPRMPERRRGHRDRLLAITRRLQRTLKRGTR